MLGLLTANGHEIVDSEEEADAIVINTCCFIQDAKDESVNTILEMAEYKKSGICKVLIVTGCMAQRYKEEIIQEILITADIHRIPTERHLHLSQYSLQYNGKSVKYLGYQRIGITGRL